MLGIKVSAMVCSALVVAGAGLLHAQADVTVPPADADLMMAPPHDFVYGPVQCIDGVCTPVRITNGFHQTRWRKWPISPPTAAPRGAREGISPPAVDVPAPDVEADIPGRVGTPQGQPRSEQPNGATPAPAPDLGAPDGGTREPSASPTLPIEPREPELPPELSPEEFRGRPTRGTEDRRPPRLQRDDRSPRRMPPVATRILNRQASLVETLRGETIDAAQDSTANELPSVRAQPKAVSRTSGDSHSSAATPSPSPWSGTRPPRTTPLDGRPPVEQPRAGSAFQGNSGNAAVRAGVRQASATVSPDDNRVVQASTATLAVRPKIKDTWASDLVPVNPLRSRDTGPQRRFDVVQAGANMFDGNAARVDSAMPREGLSSRATPAVPMQHDLAAEAYTGLPIRNPLRK
jgi:hypothetical protein